MRWIVLGSLAFWISLASFLAVANPADAQTTIRPQTNALMVRTYLGCSIDHQQHLSFRNTTQAALRVGTPVYWSGKQLNQPPREYAAPLYAEVPPGGSYQIGGVYRYDTSVACRAWVMRPMTATRAP
jgi:hypothetical protein